MDIENIFKFVVIFFIFYFLFKVNSEKFTSTANISEEMKTAINTIYQADVGAIRTLSQIASSLNNDVAGLTIPGNLTTKVINASDNINVSNKSNEGGRVRILNELKNGKAGQTNDWSIWNMTGDYGNKLSFWRYNGDGTNAGPALDIFDNGNTDIKGNANIDGSLTTKGNANIDGTLTTKGQFVAIRADGRATHFDYTDGKNYIRGDTHHDNNLTVGGTATCTSINITSDYRIKDNVKDIITNDNFNKLRPVTYLNKLNNKNEIGFIAHEVQELFPELVNGEKDGEINQTVNYIGLIPLLVNEIKELKLKIKQLEEK
jgi:hypothetical protein